MNEVQMHRKKGQRGKNKKRPPISISPNVAYTLDEASDRLRMSRVSTAKIFEAGRIRAVREGSGWRVLGKNLMEYLSGVVPVKEKGE